MQAPAVQRPNPSPNNAKRNLSPIRASLPSLSAMGYEAVRPIGKGSFGQAYLVESLQDRRVYVAKLINTSQMSNSEKREAHNEIKMLQRLEHPHIVRYIDYSEDRACLNIIMEYADGGDLAGLLGRVRAAGKSLAESEVMRLFTQTALALKHMHDQRILHRDIKMQNVFLTKSNDVKMGDFGISTVLKSTMAMAQTVCGTPYYFSPELCAGQPYNNKSDIWALGVLLYNLCTGGEMPFDAQSMKGLMEAITKRAPRRLSGPYSPELNDLINLMLAKESKKRPNIGAVLAHPAVQNSCAALVAELTQSTATATGSSSKDSPPVSARESAHGHGGSTPPIPPRRMSRPVGYFNQNGSPVPSPHHSPLPSPSRSPARSPARVNAMRAGGALENGMRMDEQHGGNNLGVAGAVPLPHVADHHRRSPQHHLAEPRPIPVPVMANKPRADIARGHPWL